MDLGQCIRRSPLLLCCLALIDLCWSPSLIKPVTLIVIESVLVPIVSQRKQCVLAVTISLAEILFAAVAARETTDTAPEIWSRIV